MKKKKKTAREERKGKRKMIKGKNERWYETPVK